jgi:hypothetical protein
LYFFIRVVFLVESIWNMIIKGLAFLHANNIAHQCVDPL